LGDPTAKAGDIKLNATGDVRLSDRAGIRNRVNLGAQGKSGEIEIVASNLSVSNGGGLVAGTAGKGDAGNIKITATGNVSFDGVQNSLPSVAFNVVDRGAEGKGGGIEIVAGNVSITNGAGLVAGTLGKGDAGNIKITAAGNISFGGGKDDFVSAALVDSGKGAEGKGGTIEIVASNLSISNGAALQSSTDGKGDAGNIKIQVAKNVSFDNGYAFNNVNRGAQGNGGTIEIVANNILFTNSGQLTASTFGKGNAGNIKITATANVSFDGRKDGFSSSALSKVNEGAEGKGGTISIVAENLSITNGGDLQAATYGTGDAGNIKIIATSNVSVDNSSVFSRVEQNAIGKGGEIEIVTQNLFATNGGQLTASTYGKGDAGNIKITATGKVSFDGIKNGFRSAAFSTVEQGAEGKGGGIEIKTGTLSVTNGARLSASTVGQGDAGDIFLKSNTITLNKGEILSKSTSSTGGNINIITNDFLLLKNDSFIATDSKSTEKNGNGGNITIGSPLIIALPGNNDITANANRGNGGNIKIDTQGLFGIQYRPIGTAFTNDITASSTFGQSGTVQINTPGTDPGKDRGELSAATNDASRQISQACSASQRDNKFYITGRGGLPPTASEPQESEALWSDARAVGTKPATTADLPRKYPPPAIGWVLEKNGRVRLIAARTGAGVTGTRVVCPGK
jgi:large exoprotein involved in heme utilization and adhesion